MKSRTALVMIYRTWNKALRYHISAFVILPIVVYGDDGNSGSAAECLNLVERW